MNKNVTWVEIEDDSSVTPEEYAEASDAVYALLKSLPADAEDIFKTIFIGDTDEDGPVVVVYNVDEKIYARYLK